MVVSDPKASRAAWTSATVGAGEPSSRPDAGGATLDPSGTCPGREGVMLRSIARNAAAVIMLKIGFMVVFPVERQIGFTGYLSRFLACPLPQIE
jgi:hypothetical protein